MQLFFAVVTIIETLKFGSFGGAKPQKIFRKTKTCVTLAIIISFRKITKIK
jgi:hypothetical protein